MAMVPAETGVGATRRRPTADAGSSPVELALVLGGVITLLVITLGLGMRWLAVQAAEASAQRALEIMQSPDGTAEDAAAVADQLARSSRAVTQVRTRAQVGTRMVTVTVTVTSVLGVTVTRAASGPRLRFVPQPAVALPDDVIAAGMTGPS
ncbi:hypothetical protein [Frankia sp. AgB32]|uniref:hypothetical protein n=1 Tax=Frankia sp. AgB32 TaxID=631119 RepID=UPI00200D7285|nr:hypothetical protein [Frankia sp. AgB32]MCK9895035.1 hypothetical protein [Frankia sp. AgB32]